jgi:hypothetical protein
VAAKYLFKDHDHFRATHARWSTRLNRDPFGPHYRPEWNTAQCGQCKYYIPLYGEFKSDYGACSNSKSPFDQRVMFEHDGCEYFEPIDDTSQWPGGGAP